MSYTYIFLYRVGEWKRHATYWESWIYGGGCETLEKNRGGGPGRLAYDFLSSEPRDSAPECFENLAGRNDLFKYFNGN